MWGSLSRTTSAEELYFSAIMTAKRSLKSRLQQGDASLFFDSGSELAQNFVA